MKIKLLAFGVLLAGCASTADDPIYSDIDWLKSEEHAACRASLDNEMAVYKKAQAEYEKKAASYDFDSAMKVFEKEMKEYEAGTRKLMPIRPSALGAGLPPKLPNVVKCMKPPEGWTSN